MGRTILAMGGGGFTMEPANPALDDFVLTLAPAREPKILFLPTASGDPNAQISAFRATFGDRACRPIHLSLATAYDHLGESTLAAIHRQQAQ